MIGLLFTWVIALDLEKNFVEWKSRIYASNTGSLITSQGERKKTSTYEK